MRGDEPGVNPHRGERELTCVNTDAFLAGMVLVGTGRGGRAAKVCWGKEGKRVL